MLVVATSAAMNMIGLAGFFVFLGLVMGFFSLLLLPNRPLAEEPGAGQHERFVEKKRHAYLTLAAIFFGLAFICALVAMVDLVV